jgi:protease secretion system outer membrane protein
MNMTIRQGRLRRIAGFALGIALCLEMGRAAAAPLNLIEAYHAALLHDPTYRGAIFDNQAGQENIALGRAGLLPKVQAVYAPSKNRAEITTTQTSINPSYDSLNATIQIKQPLINFAALATYKQGIAKAEYSDAQFVSRAQDLVLRLVGAYADAQYAEDQLALAIAQRDAYLEQMRVNVRLFKQGEGTKTDMLETQARASLAEAQVLEARDNLTTARHTLAGIVGMEITGLAPLNKDFNALPVEPASYEAWRDIALKKNAEIVALNAAVEVAQQEINRQYSGHAPTLDLVASYGKQNATTTNTYNQDSTVRSIGVELNFPIFSGGYTSAATRQAAAGYEKTRADLDAKISQISVEVQKQFSLVLSGSPKIEALIKSVESSSLLIEATKQSIKGGVRINLDLLNAQQQLYTSRRDLAQARYNYLLAYLRLRNAAGTLGAQDLMDIAGYFAPLN